LATFFLLTYFSPFSCGSFLTAPASFSGKTGEVRDFSRCRRSEPFIASLDGKTLSFSDYDLPFLLTLSGDPSNLGTIHSPLGAQRLSFPPLARFSLNPHLHHFFSPSLSRPRPHGRPMATRARQAVVSLLLGVPSLCTTPPAFFGTPSAIPSHLRRIPSLQVMHDHDSVSLLCTTNPFTLTPFLDPPPPFWQMFMAVSLFLNAISECPGVYHEPLTFSLTPQLPLMFCPKDFPLWKRLRTGRAHSPPPRLCLLVHTESPLPLPPSWSPSLKNPPPPNGVPSAK